MSCPLCGSENIISIFEQTNVNAYRKLNSKQGRSHDNRRKRCCSSLFQGGHNSADSQGNDKAAGLCKNCGYIFPMLNREESKRLGIE